ALRQVNEDLLQRYGVALANRTGVNTGEVVANDDPGAAQKLATGDAVNVAARLEQAAPENEIYLGETTYRLVRDAVTVEAVEPLELKGKAERVAAYRLVSAHGLEGSVRRQDTPVVGRDTELAALDTAFRDLLDHLLDSAASASVLLLATARHDLLEERPQWGERAGATRLVLKPLTDAASAQVVSNLLGSAELPAEVVQRIVVAAEGNPL